jgi:hypothetical protein
MKKIWGILGLMIGSACSTDVFRSAQQNLTTDSGAGDPAVTDDAGLPFATAARRASFSTDSPDAGTLDASQVTDATLAVDASVVVDASVTVDASVIVDAAVGIDASQIVDAAPAVDAFVCNSGDTTCNGYQYLECSSNQWVWNGVTLQGQTACCEDSGRWTMQSSTVAIDTTTGLTWYRYPWSGGWTPSDCALVLSGSTPPTMAQYQALVVGPGYCAPTLDSVAFPGATQGQYWGSDGCYDMLKGVADPTCKSTYGAPPNWLCVK